MLRKFMRSVGVLALVALLAVGYLLVSDGRNVTPLTGGDTDIENPDDERPAVNDAAAAEFRAQLETEVRSKIGQPIEGYEPQMFLQVFPNLEAQDFDDVKAQIGRYEFQNGRLEHVYDKSQLIHSAAGSMTAEGYSTLLENVTDRLNLIAGGDVAVVVAQLGAEVDSDGDEPVACTMDAKQCPDGSYVGRVGPNCEFAPCPGVREDSDDEDVLYCRRYDDEGNEVKEVCQLYNDEVCALIQVQCVTEPCEPVRETIMNPCMACYERENVISYTMGACEEDN